MAKVKFGVDSSAGVSNPVQDAEVVAAEAAQPSPVTGPTVYATPAVRPSFVPAKPPEYVDSDVDFERLDLPKFKIVQGVGPLSVTHTPGQMVLSNRSSVVALSGPPPKGAKDPAQVPIRGIILAVAASDRYSEKTGNGADRGRLFNTKEEVYAAGGTLNWAEHKATGAPRFAPLMGMLMLIEKPEALSADEDDGGFCIEVGGKNYNLVQYHVGGVAYSALAARLRTDRKMRALKSRKDAEGREVGGYVSKYFELTCALSSFGEGKSAYVPVLKYTGDVPYEVQQEARAILSN